MPTKKSWMEHLSDAANIPVTDANYASADTVGMMDVSLIHSATQIMARDIANWGATDFSTIEFQNNDSLQRFINHTIIPVPQVCTNLQGADSFKYRNSNGSSYYEDEMINWGTPNSGLGWNDCMPTLETQTNAADVENQPRHFTYHVESAADASRVRGIGGFNNGDATAIGRYFVREKHDEPKNCMDILLNGDSKGDGSYTIYPQGSAVTVDCDMTTEGGGWTKVWHGYPSEARFNVTTNEVYSRSNNIQFNQMRMEGVNLNESVTDSTMETAYLTQTIPWYYKQVSDQADATSPQVSFHDQDGNLDVQLVGGYFMRGYGNGWRVMWTCINVASGSLYIGGGYAPGCDAIDTFDQNSITSCASSGNLYCSNPMDTSQVDSGLGLNIKQYQETIVWVRSMPTFKTCRAILDKGFSTGSGVYLIDPDGTEGPNEAFKTYCDMETQGGGWTLVWGNTRGGTNKPVTGISFADATSSTAGPRCSGGNASGALDASGDCSYIMDISGKGRLHLQEYNYFLPLGQWDIIAGDDDFELLQQWSSDYGQPVEREATMTVANFTSANNYTLSITNYVNTVGTQNSGLYGYHNGAAFTTIDADNDTHGTNCADGYTDTPFWYKTCWSGSMNGGGELAEGHFNGSFWTSSGTTAGDPVAGTGGGNGWYFIRELTSSSDRYPSSCNDIKIKDPDATDGYYHIDVTPGTPGDRFRVYCDMTTDGGGWTKIYQLDDIFTDDTGWDSHATVPYTVDMSDKNIRFSRVAYKMTADGNDVFAAFDDMTGNNLDRIGVPSDWHYDQSVTNLTVVGNHPNITDVTNVAGKIEFWHNCYGSTGGDGAAYDYDDSRTDASPDCHGSWQVHENTTNKRTIFAVNDWGNGNGSDLEIGIGNQPTGEPDWTFTTQTYTNTKMEIFVK